MILVFLVQSFCAAGVYSQYHSPAYRSQPDCALVVTGAGKNPYYNYAHPHLDTTCITFTDVNNAFTTALREVGLSENPKCCTGILFSTVFQNSRKPPHSAP